MENLNDLTIKTYREGFAKYEEMTSKEVSGEFAEWIDSFTGHVFTGEELTEKISDTV